MPDLTKLSDNDLLSRLNGAPASSPMSDAELLSKLNQPKDNALSWRQGKEPSFLERITDAFNGDIKTGSQKATNALTYSQMLNISPSQAWDMHDELNAQIKSRVQEEERAVKYTGMKGAIKSGIDTSLVGMMLRRKAPEPFESHGQAETWVQGILSMGLDLPFFAAGYLIGGGNPVSGTAGAFGFSSGLRQVLMDRYSKGEVKSAGELFTRIGNAAKETIKGEVVGGFVGGVGKMAPIWMSKMAPGAAPTSVAGWKAVTELATMTAAGKLIEGHLPTAKDFVDNAAMLAMMHVGIGGAEAIKTRIPEVRKKLQEIYTATGVHPKEVQNIIASQKVNPKEDVVEVLDRVAEEIKASVVKEQIEAAEGGQNAQQKALQAEAPIEVTERPEPQNIGKTSTNNEAINQERIARREEPLESIGGLSDKERYDLAVKKVDAGEISPERIVERVNNAVDIGERAPTLNALEENALTYYKVKLKNSQAFLELEIDKAKAEGRDTTELENALTDVGLKMDRMERAKRYAGEEESAAFRSRQNVIDEDYTWSGMIARAQKDGVNVTPEIREQYRKISVEIRKAESEVEAGAKKKEADSLAKTIKQIQNEEKLISRKQKRELKKEELDNEFGVLAKELNSALSGLHANPFANPEAHKALILMARNRIRKGIVAAEGIVDEIYTTLKNTGLEISKRDIRDAISRYGVAKEMTKSEIDAQLNEAKKIMRLTSALEDIENGKLPPKTKRMPDSETVKEMRREVAKAIREAGLDAGTKRDTFLKNREAQIKEYERRIAEGDFSKRARQERELGKDEIEAQYKVDQIKHKFEKLKMEHLLAQRGTAVKLKDYVFETMNLIRAFKSSFDVSAVGRQGMFALLSHPRTGLKHIPDMMRALKSDEAAYTIEQEIKNRPNYNLYQKANLALSDPHGFGAKAEEMFRSRWAEYIPGIPASERAFVSYMNLIRCDLFDVMHGTAFRDMKATKAEVEALGDYVNMATGRGTIKGYENALQGLGTFLWAPRLVLSRFQMVMGKGLMPGGGRTAATRKAVLREYTRILGSLAVVYSVSSLLGFEIGDDPRSSDFGKIIVGNTRVDPLAGVSQVTVLLAREWTGEKKSLKTGEIHDLWGDYVPYGGATAWSVITDFLRTKLTPVLGLAINLRQGKDLIGQPVTLADIPAEVLVPLSVRDLWEAMNEEGIPAGMALGTLGIFGVGIQTHETTGARR